MAIPITPARTIRRIGHSPYLAAGALARKPALLMALTISSTEVFPSS
jgi:hypothetical protein